MSSSLKITEVFTSLQGEASTMGRPTTFVRLTGCPLRCGYCDSEYAFYGGKRLTIDDLLQQVILAAAPLVCVTGGEPLAQPAVHELLRRLCDTGFSASLETSGALDIAEVDDRVSIVMDLKTPDSGEQSKNLLTNVKHLKNKDQVKFVLCSRNDYEWARFQMEHLHLVEQVGEVLLSPSFGQLDPKELADWIVADRLPVRFQVQLHKLLWGDKPGV